MKLSARWLMVLLFLPAVCRADNWPAWRGPTADGHSTEKGLPLKWSPTENVRWKVALPAPGNSTPVVWGKRIFITQASVNGAKRALMCLDRADGKELWKKEIDWKEAEATHGTNPFCSASPVTVGERVVVCHNSAGLFCYDFQGKELWKKDVGKMDHIWGSASSPVLHGDLVYLWVGPGENQVLIALDKKTGETRWQHKEPGGLQGKDGKWVGSWSTPVVAKVGKREELILSMPDRVCGFDPLKGKELWTCAGLTKLVYTSPVVSKDGIVVAMSGYGGKALAVKAGGEGDVTAKNRLWHHDKSNPQRIGSAVILGEHAYLINEQGLAQCFELKTGKDLWNKERVASSAWSSLVAAEGRLYIVCENGETVVLSASTELKVLAKNKLGEQTRASIAVSDGDLFIRTYKHLWCIGGK